MSLSYVTSPIQKEKIKTVSNTCFPVNFAKSLKSFLSKKPGDYY